MGWKGILGFEYGIVQGPLGPDISGPELVAAVANAGGIGLLRAPDWVLPTSTTLFFLWYEQLYELSILCFEFNFQALSLIFSNISLSRNHQIT